MGTDLATIAEGETPPSELIAYLDDGTPYDPETGEILERTEETSAAIVPFKIDTDDGADWALEKRASVEGEILALESERDRINRNIDRLVLMRRRRLDWWNFRFENELVSYARRKLATIKGKTVLFIHGKVSFRSSKGSRSIIDQSAADAFVQRWAPSRIKVKVLPVNLTDIEAAAKAANEATESNEYDRLPFVVGTGPQEKATIDTGLKALEKAK